MPHICQYFWIQCYIRSVVVKQIHMILSPLQTQTHHLLFEEWLCDVSSGLQLIRHQTSSHHESLKRSSRIPVSVMQYTALPLIKETLKSLLKETKRDHLLKQKETIQRPFIKRKETFNFFMRYLDRMEEICSKNVHMM